MTEIARAFEGEEFEARRQQALAEAQRRQEQISAEIQRAARERGFRSSRRRLEKCKPSPNGLGSSAR